MADAAGTGSSSTPSSASTSSIAGNSVDSSYSPSTSPVVVRMPR
jgi:hypothetical protein